MITKALDWLIATVSPRWGYERAVARATLAQMQALIPSANGGGYAAAKLNRFSRLTAVESENAQPQRDMDTMRANAWKLYRDTPHGRKVVRTIVAKVVGRGLTPRSTAVREDGTADLEFRAKALKLWHGMSAHLDYLGVPGKGGQNIVGLQQTVLKNVILSGEMLFKVHKTTPTQAKKRGSLVPIAVQLIDAARLDNTADDSEKLIFKGIEFNSADERVAYHLKSAIGSHTATTERHLADNIYHIFIREDADQQRGVTWFAPALLHDRDMNDLEHNVLKSASIASCFVLGYRLPSGSKRLTPAGNADSSELTDRDGNPIEKLQPGMLLNLGREGAIEPVAPPQPSQSYEGFLAHQLRAHAAGFPGVKASTVTGDYRNSSFSSEKAADNDAWPEIEQLQDWFSSQFLQPIYEEVIRAGVLAGYFGKTLTAADFASDPARYLSTLWQGPVSRSINPTHDALAAQQRIKNGTSSPQLESSISGRDWRDNVKDIKEFQDYCQEIGLQDEIVANVLGIQVVDAMEGGLYDKGNPVETTQEQSNGQQTDTAKATGKATRVATTRRTAAREARRLRVLQEIGDSACLAEG